MIKQLKKSFHLVAVVISLFLVACSDDNGGIISRPIGSDGYYVVNEGAFNNGNTSISFFSKEDQLVTNNLFSVANGIPLGDQAQSMTVHDNKGYIVVQNSAKIEVVNLDDFKSIATISDDIVSPRYFVGFSTTKGYVSDWGADGLTGTVKVIDLTSNEVTKTLSVGRGTNRLLLNGTTLYAVNAGGWGRDNTVVVIDTNTDEISNTIEVTDNPGSLQLDKDGTIWVATAGHTAHDENFNVVVDDSTPGAIIQLEANGDEIQRLSFEGIGGPSNLIINGTGDRLYYRYKGAVYALNSSDTSLPTEKFIDKNYYGISVDPIDGSLIGCFAPNFSTSGTIDIYDSQGNFQSTYTVGIGPNGCIFK